MAGHRAVVATALMLLTLGSTGEAQTPLLVPGARVRISGPCLADLPSGRAQCAVVVGRLRSWTPDTVIVEQNSGAFLTVLRSDVKQVEVSDGVSSRKWLGAGIGAGTGLVVGLATRCVSDSGNQTIDSVGCEVVRLFYVPTLMIVGGTVGYFVGSLIRSERWLNLPGAVEHVSIVPVGTSALAITVNLRF